MRILLSEINANQYQVRTNEDEESLLELAASINEHGLLQQIKVRPETNGYELVYGHRRVAAMRLLGWTECEAILEEVSDEESLLQSIAENLQREDLDILEEAESYQTLVARGHTLKEIAELVNKPQGRISNRLSILRLPKEVQELVIKRRGQHTPTTELGGLSPDSASRIASAIETPEEAINIARKAIYEGLNSQEIRELTAFLKDIHSNEERARIIDTPWQSPLIQQENSDLVNNNLVSQQQHTLTLSDLFHRKMIWNLEKVGLENFDHFTIGYSSRNINQFLEVLQIAKIDILVDIRSVPISRFRPEFSRSNLCSLIIDSGISYLHLPSLGIPSDIRQNKTNKELFAWYDSHINVMQEIESLSIDLKSNRVAFMCVEVDPQSCHRHRVSRVLETRGFRLYDL